MGDQVILEQSLESQIVDEPFVSRQNVYVIDSNNGAYNGQIQIDTSSLSNSGRWASYSEGVLHIPLVVTLTANAAPGSVLTSGYTATSAQSSTIQDLRKNFAIGLKNGYYQLIHSLSVEYNNTNVVQLTPFLNHYVTYKLMTTLSESDLEKWGTHMGFFPDGWQSHDYDQTAALPTTILGSAGKGSVNNKNLPAGGQSIKTQADVRRFNSNAGLQHRTINCTGIDGTNTTTTALFDNTTRLSDLARNFYAHQVATNVDAFYVMAQIRLKDIADFFDKLPLTRGAYLRILVNTNTSEHRIRYAVDQAASNVVRVENLLHTSATVTGGTTPLMVASAEGQDNLSTTAQNLRAQGGNFWCQNNNINGSVSKKEYEFTVRSSIAKDPVVAQAVHPTFQNCRLYVPLYTMTNEEVSRYLTLQPTKNIVYRDVFQYQFDVPKGGTFNQLLTNGVANPKALILIPYIASSANNTYTTSTAVANPIAVWQSPFASEPGTTSPYVSIRDYNVQLAGVNIYTSNELYDFEAFRNELARINGINGGVVDGLMSGLIGQEQFAVNARYYVTDLSRRIKAEDAVPKSIQVSGTNTSDVAITVMVFLEMEKNVSVALDSGMLLG
jgi:hypothetical protein